jgi:hypothetical protein
MAGQAAAVTLATPSQIVVGGWVTTASGSQFGARAYLSATGDPDASFGSGGMRVDNASFGQVTSMALTKQGGVYLWGTTASMNMGVTEGNLCRLDPAPANPPQMPISITFAQATAVLQVGGSMPVDVIAQFADGSMARVSVGSLVVVSSDPAIVQVRAGQLLGQAPGTVIVRAFDGSLAAKMTVNVQ